MYNKTFLDNVNDSDNSLSKDISGSTTSSDSSIDKLKSSLEYDDVINIIKGKEEEIERTPVLFSSNNLCVLLSINQAFLQFQFYNKNEDVGYYSDGLGWKLHVSSYKNESGRKECWNTLKDIAIEYGISMFKMFVDGRQSGDDKLYQFTVYLEKNKNLPWIQICKEINKRLNNKIPISTDSKDSSPNLSMFIKPEIPSGCCVFPDNNAHVSYRCDLCTPSDFASIGIAGYNGKDTSIYLKYAVLETVVINSFHRHNLSDKYNISKYGNHEEIKRAFAFLYDRKDLFSKLRRRVIGRYMLDRLVENDKSLRILIDEAFIQARLILNLINPMERLYLSQIPAQLISQDNSYNPFNQKNPFADIEETKVCNLDSKVNELYEKMEHGQSPKKGKKFYNRYDDQAFFSCSCKCNIF